ncbi:MAG: tetratricopeptide repeat protein [Verrucomicrobiota bacterium]
MRWIHIPPLLMAAGAAWFLAACQTPVEEPRLEEPPTQVEALGPAERARAEALTYYGLGLIDERKRNFSGSLSNYQKALTFDPENEELHLRVAIGFLQQKRQAEAVELLESLARRHPRSEKALFSLGLIYRATSQPEKMEEIYRQLNKLNPARSEPYIELASLYVRSGKEKEALALLERAKGRVTNPADVLRTLGSLYLQRALTSPTNDEAQKNRRAALRALEAAAQKAPDNVNVLFQLGDLYIQDRQLNKAIECFRTIEEKNPNNLQVKQKLAMSFLALGDKKKAVDALEELAEDQPGNPRIYYYLGELYNDQGDQERALLNFSLAAKAGTGDAAPYVKMALLQIDRHPEGAIKALMDGLQKLPNDPVLNEVLGYTYFSMKNYKKAVEYFDQARAAVEKETAEVVNPAFYFNYAVACQMAGQLDDAARLLNKAFSKEPVYLDAYLQYAFRQKDESRMKDAVAVLEKIGQLQPDEPNVCVYLGLLNSYLKSYKASISAFEKAEGLVQDSPQKGSVLDAQFFFWYGAACERDGQFDRAEQLFGKCLGLDTNNPEAYNYLAYMWAEKGVKLEKALDYVQKALQINPNSGAFVDTLGWVYYMQGQYQDALKEINRAAELIPDDATIVEHLGDVLYKLGDEKQALPHWERSFVLDPENEKVAEKLKRNNVDLEPLRKQAEELKQKKAEEEKLKEKEKPKTPASRPSAGAQEEPSTPLLIIPAADTNPPAAEPEVEPGDEPELEPEE